MFRLFLTSSLCAILLACSSEDSTALKEWFSDQGLATSYGKEPMEIPITLKKLSKGNNDSAFMVSTFALLGKTNGIEQSLYFGLMIIDSLDPKLKLRTDSSFYNTENFDKYLKNEMKAKISWLIEEEFLDYNDWLNFEIPVQEGNLDITLTRYPGGTRDTFYIDLPPELLNVARPAEGDTIHLLLHIKPDTTEDAILRFSPPEYSDIRTLQRVAQKTDFDTCELCLRAGVRESLNVVFEIKDSIKDLIADKTVVFSRLVWPNQDTSTATSELGYPLPVYIYNNGKLESYKLDSTFIFQDSTLILQTTYSMRRYGLQDTILTLWLGNPILDIEDYKQLPRPAYASYKFDPALEKGVEAKLKIWFADYDGKE